MSKRAVISIATATVVVAVVALLLFVFLGGNKENSQIDLTGVWKVATNVNDGVVSIPQNEYMVFLDGEASDYREGNAEHYVKSSYKIDGDVLELPDISRTFHIVQQAEQYVSLYTNDDTYMILIEAESESILEDAFDPDSVYGKWEITYRPTDEQIVNEYLIFDDGTLADFRNNNEEATIETEYEWEDNIIKAPALGVEMLGARVASNRIVLIDIDEGYVWLLTKAED